MNKLVSVIIPCFNAERWLTEAIDSCLQQTYLRIEIIVIDDGSTDNCLEIIKSYENKIIWKTGPNKGGNYARNIGFALSRGEYIQYLDADDYLMPEKIERQVRCIEETGAGVVCGDWRYKVHLSDGTSFLENINVCGPKEDFLESLLADDRWVPPVGLLYTRAAVDSCSGWDESLKVGQDRDFLISVVMSGVKVVYQSGCHSIYRLYGNTTVSTSNKLLWLENHCLLMKKAEVKLAQSNKLSSRYKRALAQGYFSMSRHVRGYLDYSRHLWLARKVLLLCPNFKGEGPAVYNLIQRILGFLIAERLVGFKRQLTNQWFLSATKNYGKPRET